MSFTKKKFVNIYGFRAFNALEAIFYQYCHIAFNIIVIKNNSRKDVTDVAAVVH